MTLIGSGRKLTWLWHVMKAELKTTYLPQKYIFIVSAYQMAILCQFNENDSQTFNDLLSGTRLSDSTLKAQLGLLVKARVLLEEGETYDLNLSELWMRQRPCEANWIRQISSQRN